MSSRHVKIPAQQLQLGMFVSSLDRSWLETPFLVEGILLRTMTELKILQEICESVVIDTEKSHSIARQPAQQRQPLGKSLAETFSTRKLKSYQSSTSFAEEVVSAKALYEDYEIAVSKIYDDAKASQKLNIRSANEAVNNIVNSLVKNPDACMYLHRMKKKGDYLYNRAIGTSILSATVGRQIGLPPTDLKRLAISGMLCDIGKLSVSSRILNKPNTLLSEEYELIKSHVEIDEAFEERFPGLSQSIIDTIASHHERHDGSGYPRGLKGDEVPVFSRIVGIADCYDAMTSDQPYSKAMSTYDAAKELYDLRDIHFQAEIVEEFIQAVGLYPIGSLVELNKGAVGIVIEVHSHRRLKPKLLMLLDENKEELDEAVYLDLLETDMAQQANEIEIKCCLEPGSYGLNADDYLI